MPFLSSALTAQQKTDIRSNFGADLGLAVWGAPVVFQAQINQNTFDSVYATIDFDNVTTGAYTAILDGFTVIVSSSLSNYASDPIFVGRARGNGGAPASSTTLKINETSTAIANDQYITVIKDVKIAERRYTYDLASDTMYLDWDQSYDDPAPLIYGLQSAYVIVLSGGVADLALAPSGLAVADGAAISSWAWGSDTASFQSGSASTQNVTLRWTTAGRYMPRVTVTDDNGVTNWFSPKVYVLPADLDDSNVYLNFSQDQVSWQNDIRNGWTATLNAFDGISSIPDDSDCALFTLNEEYGTATDPIISNVVFIGRFRQQSIATDADDVYSELSETQFQIQGLSAQLGNLNVQELTLELEATPTKYWQIKDLTVWRVMAYVATNLATLSNVCSVSFDSTSETYLFPALTVKDSSAADSLQDMAQSIASDLNFSAQGEIYIAEAEVRKASNQRGNLTPRVDFTSADWYSYRIDRQQYERVGQISGNGGSYNSASGDVVAARGLVPAHAAGSGQGRSTLNGQILPADQTLESIQNTLALRLGNDFGIVNVRERLIIELVDGYYFLQANNFHSYTATIDADSNQDGISYDTNTTWYLESVSVTYNNEAAYPSVTGTLVKETDNSSAQIYVEVGTEEPTPTTSSIPIGAPPVGVIETPGLGTDNPTGDDTPQSDSDSDSASNDPTHQDDPENPTPDTNTLQGNVVAAWNAAGLGITKNFTKTQEPYWTQCKPGTNTLTDFKFDPHSNRAYALENDGTSSYFWVTDNILATPAKWTNTVTFADEIYSRIRSTKVAGEVYVYTTAAAAWEHTMQFDTASGADPDTTYGNGSFVSDTAGLPGATYSGGVGWEDNTSGTVRGVYIERTGITAFAVNSIELFFIADGATETDHPRGRVVLYNSGGSTVGDTGNVSVSNSASEQSIEWTGSVTDVVRVRLQVGLNNTDSPVAGNGIITKAIFRGTGSNPFTGSGTSPAGTRRSTDNGGTFAAVVEVGTTPGAAAGFDTGHLGNQVYAANSTNVAVATSGGAYADDEAATAGYPKCIWGYGASGDYYFGQSALNGTESIYNVTSSAADVTPNDGTNDGVVASDNALCASRATSNTLAVLASFGGTVKVCTSSNGGGTWSQFATIGGNGKYIRFNPHNDDQIYIAANSNGRIAYSDDGGATYVEKWPPVSTPDGIEIK